MLATLNTPWGPALSLHGNSAGCYFSFASKLDTVSPQIAGLSLKFGTSYYIRQRHNTRTLSKGVLSVNGHRRLTLGGRSHVKSILLLLGVGY